MTKRIIILDVMRDNEKIKLVNFACWFSIPTALNTWFANSSATSAYKTLSVPELDEIKQGKVLEKVFQQEYPDGMTVVELKAILVSSYGVEQDKVNAMFNTYRYLGAYWDGVSWTSP